MERTGLGCKSAMREAFGIPPFAKKNAKDGAPDGIWEKEEWRVESVESHNSKTRFGESMGNAGEGWGD